MKTSKHIQSFRVEPLPADRLKSRREFLGAAAALIAITAGGTSYSAKAFAAKKSTQKLVKYQSTPKQNRKCDGCSFYEADKKTCKVVEGAIDPNGWCLRWSKKKA